MALAFTGWTFDQPSYAPGATMTLTVTYTSTDVEAATDVARAVTVVVTDSAGNATQTSDGSTTYPDFTVSTPGTAADPTTVTATDPRPATWTLVSNTFAGAAPEFTGTAVLTSVAS